MLYLLHISPPLGNAKKISEFYLGFSPNKRTLIVRLEHHFAGRGARMTAAAVERGHTLRLVGVRDGDRTEERRIKRQGHHARFVRTFKMQKGLERFAIKGVSNVLAA